MLPSIFRDSATAGQLLDAVLDAPGGKRSLARLARTCRGLYELVVPVLWRELDSLLPVIGLFPSHLKKKARKPGMGLVRFV
jgi:hypothetical protein